MCQDFLKDLKWSIEETERKNKHKSSTYYKPSSMKCLRNMYYQRTGAEIEKDDISYTLVGICNSGTDIHVRIQQAVSDMKNNDIDCEYVDVEQYVNNVVNKGYSKVLEVLEHSGMETKLLKPDYNTVFLCDGIIKYKGEYYILEIKTETSRKFQTRFEIAEEHKNQAQAYASFLSINKVLFLYVCRDNLDMKAFIYEPTEKERWALLTKIDTVELYVHDKVLPNKTTDTSVCTYCQYKNRCERELC